MFSTGFKYFFGVTIFSTVALMVNFFVLDQFALAGVAISMFIAVTALLAGITVATRDGQKITTTHDSSSELVTQSMWPLVTSVGVVLLALGLVTSSLVFLTGLIVLCAALAEWMVQSWSEGASNDPSHNAFARKRLLNPIEFPVLAALGLGVVIFMFSRIMLSVDKSVGAILFIGAGTLVLVAGTLFAVKPKLKRSATFAVCAFGALSVVAGGVASAVSGERKELVEASIEGHFTHAECGAEESKYYDKLSEGTLSLRSSVRATVVYQNGDLSVQIQGLKNNQKTLSIPRSTPTNIIFRNATEGKFRLVAKLGLEKNGAEDTAAGEMDSAEEGEKKDHSNEICTQLVAKGAEQGLTLNFAKPSSSKNPYYLFIAGAEDKRIELVVP